MKNPVMREVDRLILGPNPAVVAGRDEGLLDELHRVDLFHDLSRRDLSSVLSYGRIEELPADAILGVAGSRADVFYAVLEGYVELSVPTDSGYLALGIVRPYGVFPLSALLSNGQLMSTAVAMGSVRAFAIPCHDLLACCQRSPEMAASLYRQVAEVLANHQGTLLERVSDNRLSCLAEWPAL